MELRLTTPNILVVDDDAQLCAGVAMLLTRMGYHTLTAGTVEQAVEVLQAQPVDALLLDLQLPGRYGLALIRELRQHGRGTPVVLMSGTGSMDDVIEGLRGGVVDYLRKPFNPEQLSEALDRAVRKHRAALDAPAASPAPPSEEAVEPPARGGTHAEDLVNRSGLSPRERQVFDLVVLGRTAAEIGLALNISTRTAKFHVANMLTKLGAESRADLLRVLL